MKMSWIVVIFLIGNAFAQWSMQRSDSHFSNYADFSGVDPEFLLHSYPVALSANNAWMDRDVSGTPQPLLNGSSFFYVANGVVSSLGIKGTEADLDLRWTVALNVKSSLILVNGLVIACRSDVAGYTAIDQITGAIKWTLLFPNITHEGQTLQIGQHFQFPLIDPSSTNQIIVGHRTNGTNRNCIAKIDVNTGNWSWVTIHDLSMDTIGVSESGIIYSVAGVFNGSAHILLAGISSHNASLLWTDTIPCDTFPYTSIQLITSSSIYIGDRSTFTVWKWDDIGEYEEISMAVISGRFPTGEILGYFSGSDNSWYLNKTGSGNTWSTPLSYLPDNVVIDSRGQILIFKLKTYISSSTLDLQVLNSNTGKFEWSWNSGNSGKLINCPFGNSFAELALPSTESQSVFVFGCNSIVVLGCCSGNGKCGNSGKCQCDDGWYGDQCDVACESEKCLHENMRCSESGYCECDEHYSGSECDVYCLHGEASEGGLGEEEGEGPKCECEFGWAGDHCDWSRWHTLYIGCAIVGSILLISWVAFIIVVVRRRQHNRGYTKL